MLLSELYLHIVIISVCLYVYACVFV
uniref:Uncharacterized protein n=1 Tax=Anguilla anguilla TaxID=7936 RepID=A0A0E9VB45_ANGAN